jgi:hypothetical protein
MDTSLIIVIVAGVVLIAVIVFAFIFLRKRIKKNKAVKETIPIDILEDFNEAERRLKESNGEEDPIMILWEIAKKRSEQLRKENEKIKNAKGYVAPASIVSKVSKYGEDPINRIKKEVTEDGGQEGSNESERARPSERSFGFAKSKSANTSGELHSQSTGRESIQDSSSAGDRQQHSEFEGVGRNGSRGNENRLRRLFKRK